MLPLVVIATAFTLTATNTGTLKIDLPGLEGVYTAGEVSTQRSATMAPPSQYTITGVALHMTGMYQPGEGYCGETQVVWDIDFDATLRSPGSTASQGDAEMQFFGQELSFDLTSLFVRLNSDAFRQTSLTVEGAPVRVDDCSSMLVTSPAVVVVQHAELIVYTQNVPTDRATWSELKAIY